MRDKIKLPDYSLFLKEINQQMGAPAEAICGLTEFIIKINDSASIPQNISEWINSQLPRFWAKVIEVKKTSRSVVNEVVSFYNNIVKLITKLELPSQLLEMLANSLKEIDTTPALFEPDTLNEKEKQELRKLNGSLPVMKKIHPTIADHNVNLIRALFDCGLFSEVSNSIKKNSLTAAQLTPLMKIFTYIEPYIDTKYTTYLIQLYSDAALEILKTEPPSAREICLFINTFVRIMPEKLDRIYQVLCGSVKSDKIQVVFQCITCIGRIMRECGLGKSGQIVKEAMLEAAANKNPAVYSAALESMKEVIEKTKFNLADFKQILDASTWTEDDMHLKILAQTPSLKDEADNFAAQYITSGQVYPPLNCMLIDFCKKERLRKTIFKAMIEKPEIVKKADFSVYKVGDRTVRLMKEAFENEPSPEAMVSIAYLYLNNPVQDSLPDFLKMAVHNARGNNELVEALERFAGVATPEPVFIELFDEILSSFSSDDASTDRLSRVAGRWAAAMPVLPESTIIEKLMPISFTEFPDYFPHFVDTLSQRMDSELVSHLLLKMADDGVPMMHARWLVFAIFRLIYNDEEVMTQFVNNTIHHSIDSVNRERAIALLTCAAGIEADFFRLGESFGLNQDIGFRIESEEDSNTKEEKVFTACFHPYHSSRRLYAEASRLFEIPINSFILSNYDGLNDNDIPLNYPLTSLPLGTKQKLDFKVRILSKPRKVPEELSVISQCKFLKLLGSTDNIKSLYHGLIDTSEESQSLLILMMLFDPVGEMPRVRAPLQHIIKHSIKDILEFVELPRVFPFALRSIAASGSTIQRSSMDTVINALTDYSFDTVSLAIACQALPCFQCQCNFSRDTLQHTLLDSGSLLVRNAMVELISPEIDPQIFISMLPLTAQHQYRSKTEQFFECISRFPLNEEIYASIYRDMDQFEFSHYGDIDQTFIALTKLIPTNEEMISLMLERLYLPPTADTLNRPWVHTLESWGAALEYLEKPEVIPHLNKYLEQLPKSIEPEGLSDDFTYMGRCGIQNEGNTCYISSVLQILNCVPGITQGLLECNIENLSPMLLELRQILAELKFTRGVTLSIRDLTGTLERFDPNMQMDAEEFFMEVYNSLREDIKDNDRNLVEPLEGHFVTYKKEGKTVISKSKDKFFRLTFTTEFHSDLYQSMIDYFKPSTPSDGDSSVIFSPVIEEWPDILTIHLARTRYDIKEQRMIKMTHEYQYPVVLPRDVLKEIFGTDPGGNYKLTGAVVHAGTVEDGHYMAIVEGLDKDWYLCDDNHISYFGLDELPKYSFGGDQGTDEDTPLSEVWTAYLLFYRKEGIEYPEPVLPDDLKANVNELNRSEWPSTVFYSKLFVEYARSVFEKSPDDDAVFSMAVTVLFKIAVADVSILTDWALSFADLVMQEEKRCIKLFECIESNIGDSLPNFVGISDEAASELGTLMNSALSRITGDTRPINCLLRHLKGNSTKRCISLAYEFILTATRSLKIDWTQEDDTLSLIVQYILEETTKDGGRPHGRTYFACFQQVCQILTDVSETVGATGAVLAMFDQTALSKIAPIGRRCEPFMTLLTNLAGISPALFQEIAERASSNRDIQSLMLSVSAADLMMVSSEIPDVSLGFMWDVLPHLIFHEREAIRDKAVESVIRLMRQPDSKAIAFFERGLVEEGLPVPSFFDGSSMNAYFIGLLLEASKRIEEGCDLDSLVGYASILRRATMLSPKSLIPFVPIVGDLIARSSRQNSRLEMALIAVLHDAIVFDRAVTGLLSDEAVEAILGVSEATQVALQLVVVFGERSRETPLAGACASYYLSVPFDGLDGFGGKFTSMVEGGLNPGGFEIPREAPGIANIGLAKALWELHKDSSSQIHVEMQDQLEEYMLSALRFARPVSLYKRVKKVAMCLEILRERKPTKLEEVFPGL